MATDVAFRVDAGGKTGLGHVVRSLCLADELAARGCSCTLAGNDDMRAWAATSDHATAGRVDEVGDADVWIVDIENGCPPSLARSLRDRCKVLVILNGVGYNDVDEGRLLADLVFYQGCTRRPHDDLDWTGFNGQWFEGPKWVILRPWFLHLRRFREVISPPVPRVLVAGGGADRDGIAMQAARALHNFCDVRVIVGPFSDWNYPSDVELVVAPRDSWIYYNWADLAVISYGMTAFECLCNALPVLAVSISEDHEKSARLVEQYSNGALVSLGKAISVSDYAIAAAVALVSSDLARRSREARWFVDGKGAGRVADKIMEALG